MSKAVSPRATVLQDLAVEVRTKTLQVLQWARPHECLWAPPGTANHILWHAGHSLWVEDALCIKLVAGKSELPAGWGEMFQMGSRPAGQTKPWPGRDELYRQLKAQLARLLELTGGLTHEQLDALPPHAHPGDERTLGQSILHGLHDEANHQGEMYLLVKIQRLNPARASGSNTAGAS